jgi:hypothetical protein
MSHVPGYDHEQNSDSKTNAIDRAYVFDEASGLYKPRSDESTKERKAQQDNPDPSCGLHVVVARDWVSITLTALTLIIVAAYTYYSAQTVSLMKMSEQRAWVKLGEEELTLATPPDFGPSGGPKDYPPTPPFSSAWVGVDFPLRIENVGKLPAIEHFTWAELRFDTSDNDWQPYSFPDWWVNSCQIAENDMGGGLPPGHQPLMPGVTNLTETADGFIAGPAKHTLSEVFIIVCTAYRQMDGTINHSAIAYCPSQIEFDNPFRVLQKPEVWYVPETVYWDCTNHFD